MVAYQAALIGQPASLRPQLSSPAPGTIAAPIASYMRSAEYIGLHLTSKAGYGRRLEMLRTEHGHRTVAGLSREPIASATKGTSRCEKMPSLWGIPHQMRKDTPGR